MGYKTVSPTTSAGPRPGTEAVRTFVTGATRSPDSGKLDYEGFESPLVVQRFAEFMNKHRIQSDGNQRDSDNWQKGITKESYIKSGHRHFMDWWLWHRGFKFMSDEEIEDALCALSFNVNGYLFEFLKSKLAANGASATVGADDSPVTINLDEFTADQLIEFSKEYLESTGYKVTTVPKRKTKKR